MKDFFIRVVKPRKDRETSTYHVMERYKEGDDPFEKVQQIATCNDVAGAEALQKFFDEAHRLEKALAEETAATTAARALGRAATVVALTAGPGDTPSSTFAATPMVRDKPPSPEVTEITQPEGLGDMATGVVRTGNSTKKKVAPGKRRQITGKDLGLVSAVSRPADGNGKVRDEKDGEAL